MLFNTSTCYLTSGIEEKSNYYYLNLNRMLSKIHIFILFVGAFSAPIDEPIRVDLPVYDQPQTASHSEVYISQPFEIENHPDDQQNNLDIDNVISKKFQSVTNVLGEKAGSLNSYGLFSPPVTSRENAILETEGFGSKTLSIKENVEKIAVDLFQPKPLLDNIREEEKYGNSGDKFYKTGQALVSGSSRLAKFINSILQTPGNIIKQITRATSEKLNNLGGKIVGL